jgi:hypothetical protein
MNKFKKGFILNSFHFYPSYFIAPLSKFKKGFILNSFHFYPSYFIAPLSTTAKTCQHHFALSTTGNIYRFE